MSGRPNIEGSNPVELPPTVQHVWGWFLTVHNGRQVGMNGPSPISNLEILAFYALEQIMTDGWETNAIRRLDMVAMASQKSGAEPKEE